MDIAQSSSAAVSQLAALREATDRRLQREIALLQLAVQQQCDRLFDLHFAKLIRRYSPEAARSLALERVKAYRRACKPKLDEMKRILRNTKECEGELARIVLDYPDLLPQAPPDREACNTS